MYEIFIIYCMVTIICLAGWGKAQKRLVEARKKIKFLEGQQKSTPVKELAADFRDFVQSIDGHVSNEVEAAIKKLEEEQKPKTARVALPVTSTVASQLAQGTISLSVPQKPRIIMNVMIWNAFVSDFKTAEYSDEAISIIKRWGKKYIFALDDQVELIADELFDEDDREVLRDYFDDNHGSQVLSIGKLK